MDIGIINITATETDHIIQITPDTLNLGSQFDNNVIKLNFTRPETCINDNLVLIFKDKYRVYDTISLGIENEFTISDVLTQSTYLSLQIYFESVISEREYSNEVKFSLRPSYKQGNFPPIPTPSYELPIATEGILGGIKASDTITVDEDGNTYIKCTTKDIVLVEDWVVTGTNIGLYVDGTIIPAGTTLHDWMKGMVSP